MSPALAPAPKPPPAMAAPTATPQPPPAMKALTATPAVRVQTVKSSSPSPAKETLRATETPISEDRTLKPSSLTPAGKAAMSTHPTMMSQIPNPTPMAPSPGSERGDEECEDLTSLSSRSKAILVFEDVERFKVAERPREHEDLFENYRVELHKKEKAKAAAEHKVHVAEYRDFLESCDFIKATTQWKKVQGRLEDDVRCSRLEKIDRLDIFQEYIRHLEKDEEDQKQIQKIKESHAYLAVASNKSGLMPRELSDDIEELDRQLLKKDEEIGVLRALLHEAESMNAKLQKNLEEAYATLRKQSVAEKGLDEDANKGHGAKIVSDKRSKKVHPDQKNKTGHKRSGHRSRIAAAIARCHDIIVCENEVGALQVLKLLDDPEYKILHEVDVPGLLSDPNDKDKAKKKLNAMTSFGKILFLGMIDDLYRLHRAGLSLDGNFKMTDFYWLRNKRVKLGANLKDHILRRSPKRMNRDYHRLCKLMRHLLAQCKIRIPVDLQFLLNLMESDNPVSEQILIRYNICLMDEISKRTYTLSLYSRLEQFDAEDIPKFGWKERKQFRSAAVYDYIIAGDEDWSNAMADNIFVNLIYAQWQNDSGRGPFKERRHLVELLRHLMVHLPLKAYYHGKIQFTDANVAGMVEMLTPGLFSQFQAGMYAIKQIAYPHLMRVMRV